MGTLINDYESEHGDFYATRDWILERLAAIKHRAARLQLLQSATDACGSPAESFNGEQFGKVVAMREIGRRNGDYRGESFDATHYGNVMAERERRRLAGDEQ